MSQDQNIWIDQYKDDPVPPSKEIKNHKLGGIMNVYEMVKDLLREFHKENLKKL